MLIALMLLIFSRTVFWYVVLKQAHTDEHACMSADYLTFRFIMQLWEATLSNAPSIVPQLLDLFPYLVGIVNRGFDHLEVRIHIHPPQKTGGKHLCSHKVSS